MLKENKKYFPTRFALFILLSAICVITYASFSFLIEKRLPIFKSVLYFIKILFALSVVSSKLSSEAKCSWLFFILILPFAAIPAYFVFYRTRLSKKEKALIKSISDKKPKNDGFNGKIRLKCNDNFAFLSEIADFSNISVYSNTQAQYIENAQKMIDMLISDVRKAKKFIFLEFYTVAAGSVFGELCELLIKKAAEGIEVRIIYDELGSIGRLPEEFIGLMKEKKITAASHASLTGAFPGAINNRNHRKIAVVDGEIAYTGGINLADEYINPKKRIGKWKDSAVRIEGDAVDALTYTFLSDFTFCGGTPEDFSKYYKYKKRICEGQTLIFDDGPMPVYNDRISERIILAMILAAEKYFTVTTPYLICSREILSAIRGAVRRGVSVKIIIPSKPDKIFPWILTRHYARALSESGAEIYVYSPGFLHSKIYCADGKYLMCGSVNLDYRSLSHNFENGALFAFHPVIREAERDLEEILRDCIPFENKKERLPLKLLGAVMELFAPLF